MTIDGEAIVILYCAMNLEEKAREKFDNTPNVDVQVDIGLPPNTWYVLSSSLEGRLPHAPPIGIVEDGNE